MAGQANTAETMSIADALKTLSVDPAKGLTTTEATQRLGKYGPNALEENKKSELAVFLGFFWRPIPWMIEAAALMALIVRDWGDFVIITALLVFNAVLGLGAARGFERSRCAEEFAGDEGARTARRRLAGSGRRPSFPATSSASTSATSCRRTASCSRATTSASIRRRSPASRCRSEARRSCLLQLHRQAGRDDRRRHRHGR